MNRVLVLDGDAAHAVAIMECLRSSGYATAVLCSEKNSYGYRSFRADERYIGPDSHDREAYHRFLMRFLDEHPFDVLIPTSDVTAEYMSRHKAELAPKTGVLMPDPEIFTTGYDKNRLMAVCREKGYPHPQTVDLASADLASDEMRRFPYPALLKPNLTSGGRGMTLVRSSEELAAVYPGIREQYGDCHLQRFVRPGGRQIKVQIFTDANRELRYGTVIWKQRYYPVNGGSSCCNVTIEDPGIVAVCAGLLKEIGWVGFADFDLIEDPDSGELLIMELNPRLPACIRSVFKSGIDFATMIADATLGRPLRRYEYRPGKSLRHLGFEILWFLKSPDRFRSRPSWFRFFGKNIYYQDWVGFDLLSFLCGSFGNLKKQLNPEFRRAKSGVKL